MAVKLCYILRGVPGSGKSTFATLITPDAESIHEADKYMVNEAGEYEFNPARLAECHDKCYNAFLKDIEAEKPVVVLSNTSTQVWEYVAYVAAALQHDYNVIEVTLSSNFQNVHGCPGDRVAMFKERFHYRPVDQEAIKTLLSLGMTPHQIKIAMKEREE